MDDPRPTPTGISDHIPPLSTPAAIGIALLLVVLILTLRCVVRLGRRRTRTPPLVVRIPLDQKPCMYEVWLDHLPANAVADVGWDTIEVSPPYS